MIDTLRARLAALAAAGGLAAAAHAQQPPPDPLPQPQPVPAAPANPLPVDPGVDKPLPPDGVPAGRPKVVRWDGGYVLMNGPEVVVRQSGVPGGRGRSANVITGSGNGFGNTIVVDGGAGGTTVVRNARNGVGNRLIVNGEDILADPDDDLADLPGWIFGRAGGVNPLLPKPAPADPVFVPKPAPGEPVGPAAQPAPAGPKVYRGKAHPFWDRKAFSEAHDCNLYWSPADKLWFRYASDDDTYRPVADGPAAPEPPAR